MFGWSCLFGSKRARARIHTRHQHINARMMPQVLTLAGPAVLVNTALLGVTAKYVLPYGWDWPMALLFGSMLRYVRR